jgi:hypothetical protein
VTIRSGPSSWSWRLMIGDQGWSWPARPHQCRIQAEKAVGAVVDLILAADLAGLDRQAASARRPGEPAASGCSPDPPRVARTCD